MRGRKRRLFIHEVVDEQGNCIQRDDNIANSTRNYLYDNGSKTVAIYMKKLSYT